MKNSHKKDHLTEARLMELGLDPRAEPIEEEAQHLESCETCAQALREDQELTNLLEEQPKHLYHPLPQGFVEASRQRFQERFEQVAQKNQQQKSQLQKAQSESLFRSFTFKALALELSLVFSFGLALGAVFLLSVLYPSNLVSLVVALARTLATLHVALGVLVKTPALAMITFAYAAVTLLFCAGFLSHMAKTKPLKATNAPANTDTSTKT